MEHDHMIEALPPNGSNHSLYIEAGDCLCWSKCSHPPQAARMNWIMHSAISWCKQNRRDLEVWMTRAKFQILMNTAATATRGMNGGKDWQAQSAFLQSVDGSEYIKGLDAAVKTHIQSLWSGFFDSYALSYAMLRLHLGR